MKKPNIIEQMIVQSMQPISVSLNDVQMSSKQQIKPIYDTLTQLKQSNDKRERVNGYLVEMGYPPIWDSHLISKIDDKINQYNAKDSMETDIEEEIYQVLFGLLNQDEMQRLLVNWGKQKFLAERFEILESAIKCHNSGLYYSSIATLMPQMEGIIFEVFNHRNLYQEKFLNIYLNVLFETEEEKDQQDDYFTFNYKMRTYYKVVVLEKFYGSETPSELSRHALSHGYLKTYGTPSNSLKIILFFKQVMNFLSILTSEDIVRAQSKVQELIGVKKSNHITKERLKVLEKENEAFKSLLLEFVGYEDEWLPTQPGLGKKKKEELIEHIQYQRQLMKELYKKLDHKTQNELKIKVESCIWPIMHNED
ncbi:hypothetical protein [Bacillus atrophaeus]|uniref:hypothetical protein n=1 Tax=Bacillus atrophaeus TaxID=1452 RepID=UPI002E2160C2|nr:hypothetical protein [Bacillus atrophaeus]